MTPWSGLSRGPQSTTARYEFWVLFMISITIICGSPAQDNFRSLRLRYARYKLYSFNLCKRILSSSKYIHLRKMRCDFLPKRARWSCLACSGLPTVSRKKYFSESHIINPLLTKLVRSRWLDFSLRVYGP